MITYASINGIFNMNSKFFSIVIFLASIHLSKAWRPFYFTFEKLDYTKDSQFLGFLNCSFVRSKRNIESFNMNAKVAKDLKRPQLDLLIIGGNHYELANITNMDICSFLESKGTFKLIQIIRNEIARSSNLPRKCPVAKGTMLYVKNFNINPDNFPPYIPEATLSVVAVLKENNKPVMKIDIRGAVKHKKSSNMRGK
ncbi:uncharacterized protein LOC142220500 [Haematobia irritans]|uniref:uncharacterized protein LOC142220500 n=1 Tax=Haematobia irritans TaxID=7368 RepID=UPI003F4FB07E